MAAGQIIPDFKNIAFRHPEQIGYNKKFPMPGNNDWICNEYFVICTVYYDYVFNLIFVHTY